MERYGKTRRRWTCKPASHLWLLNSRGKYGIELDDDPSQFYLQGGLDAPELTGNINISGGYYKQNWETVRDWLAGASVTEMDVMLDYPILRDLELEIGIDIADNFEVRSSIAGPNGYQNPPVQGNSSVPFKNRFTTEMSPYSVER